jgi:hypothetical protein
MPYSWDILLLLVGQVVLQMRQTQQSYQLVFSVLLVVLVGLVQHLFQLHLQVLLMLQLHQYRKAIYLFLVPPVMHNGIMQNN